MLVFGGIFSVLGYIIPYFIKTTEASKYYQALIPTFIVGIWFALYESCFWSSVSILVQPKNILYRQREFQQKSVSQILGPALDPMPTGTEYNLKTILKSKSYEDYCERMPNLSGIAYGIINTVANIGLAVLPLLYGYINNEPSEDTYNTS